jgi:hypothetical protein
VQVIMAGTGAVCQPAVFARSKIVNIPKNPKMISNGISA